MRTDRLATVLRVRELVERRRLAERATAVRAADAARHGHEAAREAQLHGDLAPDVRVAPSQLLAARLGGIALGEAVEHAAVGQAQAERAVVAAEHALVAAAVERRSAERLRDRRAAAASREEQKVELRRSDEIALQQWRAQP